MKLYFRELTAILVLASAPVAVNALDVSTGTGADVSTGGLGVGLGTGINANVKADPNANPAANANDVTIHSSTGNGNHAAVPSNAAQSTFGIKTSSTLKARAERNEKTAAEIESVRKARQADMLRSGRTYNADVNSAAGVDTSGNGVNTSTIGKANVGIGSNIGTREGGGTRN